MKTVGRSDDRVATEDADEAIYSCFWQADGKHLLYLKDTDGDENTHLFQTDIRTRQTRDLTPLAGARVKSPIVDIRHVSLVDTIIYVGLAEIESLRTSPPGEEELLGCAWYHWAQGADHSEFGICLLPRLLRGLQSNCYVTTVCSPLPLIS